MKSKNIKNLLKRVASVTLAGALVLSAGIPAKAATSDNMYMTKATNADSAWTETVAPGGTATFYVGAAKLNAYGYYDYTGFDSAADAAAEPGARAVAQPTAGRRAGYDVRGGDAHGGCARADAAPEAGRGARRGRRPRSYGARRGLLHQTLLVSARMSPTHFKVKSLSGKIFTSVLAFTLAVIVALSVTMTTIYYLYRLAVI